MVFYGDEFEDLARSKTLNRLLNYIMVERSEFDLEKIEVKKS